MLEDALRRDDREALAESLGQIQAGVQESYDDVRELLTNFRASLAAEDLFSAVDAILSAFAGKPACGWKCSARATARCCRRINSRKCCSSCKNPCPMYASTPAPAGWWCASRTSVICC